MPALTDAPPASGTPQESQMGWPLTARVPEMVPRTPISAPTETSMLPVMITIDSIPVDLRLILKTIPREARFRHFW